MKVLDAGTEQLPNIDVLQWIQSKRSQHAAEDTEAQAAGRPKHVRPQNFLTALKKHERELSSPSKYPYTNNPSAYGRNKQTAALRVLDQKLVEEILHPLEADHVGRGTSAEELEKTLGEEEQMKSLTEPEMVVLMNHAPQNVEMLQPMIENYAARFEPWEQAVIVKAVGEVLRADENRTGAVKAGAG